MRLGKTTPRRSRSAAWAASGWDATQPDLAVRCGRQDDVVGLDARQFFEDGPRRVAEARVLLPHLEALPEHEGEEANEDVGLDPVLALMPDRTQVQLIFVNAKSRLGLSELDVGLPKLLGRSNP